MGGFILMNDVLLPQVNSNCRFCNFNQWMPAGVRVLNAAVNYDPFSVTIGNNNIATNLDQGSITRYNQVNQGYQTVTLSGSNGYIYVQKQVYIGDGMTTIAIINTASGLDLLPISDTACATNAFSSCIRVANLAYYSGPVNVELGNVIFSSVPFRDVTAFSRVSSGNYTARISRPQRPGNMLLSVPVNLSPNRIYTMYIMNWNASADAIQTLLVEDRRS